MGTADRVQSRGEQANRPCFLRVQTHMLKPTPQTTQDGADPAVKQAGLDFTSETKGLVRLVHHGKNATAAADEDPDTAEKCSNDVGRPGHQLFLMRLFFECLQYPAVLLLRDDARLAPDALAYFAGTQWLLSSDKSIWCVAGGSPLSGEQPADDPSLLLRTDAAPGGPDAAAWLVSRGVGLQVLQHWRETMAGGKVGRPPRELADSSAGWARFLASTALRRGRQCVVPGLARVKPAARGRGGPVVGGAAGGKATEGGGTELTGVDWMQADVSWVMEPSYSQVVLQVRRCEEV
jgi:hypothetical protein